MKDVLEELDDLLGEPLDAFTFEAEQSVISLNAPSVDFVGKEIKVVRRKASEQITESQESEFSNLIFVLLCEISEDSKKPKT